MQGIVWGNWFDTNLVFFIHLQKFGLISIWFLHLLTKQDWLGPVSKLSLPTQWLFVWILDYKVSSLKILI